MTDIITVCIEAAKEAGEFLRSNFGKEIASIETKADQSLATNLDKEAERLIVDRIKRKFPAHGIIGEERGRDGGDSCDYLWIIDPLDGTHNFIRGISIFGVSIGVVRGDHFIAGVVYHPVSDELYVGEKGNGAYKNQQRIFVSPNKDLQEATINFDSSLKTNRDQKLRVLRDLAAKAFNIRMLGATSRQMTYLAEGKMEAVIDFEDHPWDFAAGACIIEEAGGKLTNIEGGELTYRHHGYIASNGLIHPEILKIVHQK